MLFRFDEVEVDTSARRVTAAGEPVHLEPQAFDVLEHLIRHRDRAVTKEELLDEIWGSRFVTASALTSRIKSVRAAVGDDGRSQRVIRTLHRTGYQFVADIAMNEPIEPSGQASAGAGAVRRLPQHLDHFEGRRRELDELRRHLESVRLVTILGPGGVGKTRLAIEYARSPTAGDDVAFVDLAQIRTGDPLPRALSDAIGVEPGQHVDVVGACCAYLRGRPFLVVIDNCEHVLSDAAELVQRLLADTDTVTVIATSRVPIGLRQERSIRLGPLAMPTIGGFGDTNPVVDIDRPVESVALFVERAERVRDDFVLDEMTARPVADLCRALDGMPLAIELAASRMDVFSPDDLLPLLNRRLDVLRDDRRDTVDRHQSLRTALEWSFDLLDDDAQRLFDHLAVFPAGLVLAGVEWLGERLGLRDPVDALGSLMAASLITRVDRGSGSRYTQLETMRSFGLDRLAAAGQLDGAQELLVEGGFILFDWMSKTLESPMEIHWNDRVRAELPSIRAMRALLRRDRRWSELVRVSAALHDWGHSRHATEIWTWVEELAEVAELSPEDADRVSVMRAQVLWIRGRYDEIEAVVGDLADRSVDEWVAKEAIAALSAARLFAGDLEGAAELSERRWLIDASALWLVISVLANTYLRRPERARDGLARMRRAVDETQWPSLEAWWEYVCGELAASLGDPVAEHHLRRAADISRRAGAAFVQGVAEVTLAGLAADRGDVAEAARRYRSLIEHWRREGSWTQLWTTLRNAADLMSDHDPALALLAVQASFGDPFASELTGADRAQLDALSTALRARLDDDQRAAVDAQLRVLDRDRLAERMRDSLQPLIEPGDR